MRIAQVAPRCESVRPRLHGGAERVVSYLTEELLRLGHEVTLFAGGDSVTEARLISFDVTHFHCDYPHFPLLGCHSYRNVTTLHGLPSAPQADIPLVSISKHQRSLLPGANWRATVYHGLPKSLHAYREESGRYLAFLGGMSPEDGLERAIEIAQRAQVELRIAARIHPEQRSYFKEQIFPLLRAARRWVEFIGEVCGAEKDRFLGSAKALLFPIDGPAHSALVPIESLACGTPVIGWRNGSVPELITDGRTGFIVDSLEEAVHAVERIDRVSRRVCREVFEKRFDAARMANDYLFVYRHLLHAGAKSGGNNGGRYWASEASVGRLQPRDNRCA